MIELSQVLGGLPNAPECTMTKGLYLAKELLGESSPFVREQRMDGEIIIFNDHFVLTVMEALTTDCIAKMSRMEKDVLFDYLTYLTLKMQNENYEYSQDDTPNNTQKDVILALDQFLVNETLCIPRDEMNSCYDSVYVYESCSKK